MVIVDEKFVSMCKWNVMDWLGRVSLSSPHEACSCMEGSIRTPRYLKPGE